MQEKVQEPPWIERHRDAQKLVNTISNLRRTRIYTSDEIVKIVGDRYRKIKRRRPGIYGIKDLELRRLEVVFNVVYSRLQEIAKLPKLDEMSDFHRVLVENFVGANYEAALKRVRRALKLIREFWNEYKLLIISAQDAREASRYRREGSGRILSVVRRLKQDLEILRKVHRELLHTHIISEGLPVVVIAGIPSSGKSTLVKRLSTAKPEVAPYPFTTRNIIVGKTRHKGIEFYVVDTPGILERPRSQQNEIERKALAAISTLPDVIVYLFDPSDERIQDIDEQIMLLRDIYTNIIRKRDIGLIIAVNKIDITSFNEVMNRILNSIHDILDSKHICVREVIPISALTGKNIERLINSISSCLQRVAPWLFISTEQCIIS